MSVVLSLRARILLALGLPVGAAHCAAPASQAGTQTTFEPAATSPSTTATSPAPAPAAQPAAQTASPTPPPAATASGTWTVTFAIANAPDWCAQGEAECHARSPGPSAAAATPAGRLGCASEVQVLCGCAGGTVCRDPNAMCAAPLHAPSTAQARAQHAGACCYVLPTHCTPPNAGRPVRARDAAGVVLVARVAPRGDWAA